MQPPATDIVIAHAPADISLARYYAIALRTQGADASPYSPIDQPPEAVGARMRAARALVALVTDEGTDWASGIVSGYRELMSAEQWRRIVIIRRSGGEISPEMQHLPVIDGVGKPVEEVASEILALLGDIPMPVSPAPGSARIPTARPATMRPALVNGPPQWPGAQPLPRPPGDDLLTRRALLIAGLAVGSMGAVALMTSATLTRGFGLFAGSSATPPSVVAGQMLFTGSGSALYAVDLASGARRWTFTADATIRPAEVSAQGLIYAISEKGTLYALSTTNGKPRWQATIPGSGPVLVRPVLAGGLLYAGSDDHNVYALHASDGSVAWQFMTGAAVEAQPTLANNVVYVGSRDGKVYALGATDGRLIWKFATGGPVASSAAVGAKYLYIGSDDRNLWALHLSTGNFHWNFITGNRISSSPVLVGNTVYVGSQNGGVYAIDADSPVMRWRFATGAGVLSSPVAGGGVIYVGSDDHNVYAISTDGRLRWKFKTGAVVQGRPILRDGVVYVSSDHLYALNASSGTPKWQFSADGKSSYYSPGITQ